MMKAGIGKCELTPPLGIELAGYGYYLERRATHVTDPLYARALYIETDLSRLMLVSCELLGVNEQIVSDVRGALAARGLSDGQIMIVSIHTHTGPCMIYHHGCGEVDPAFVATVAGKIVRACEAALEDAHGVTRLLGVCGDIGGDYAYNRASAQGPVDRLVRGFVLERGSAAPIAAVSYACHAVSRGRATGISADYPGAVNALMEEKGYQPIYINGLCGDIDPAVREGDDRDAALRAFSEGIVKAVFAHLEPLETTLETTELKATLHLRHVSRQELRAAADGEVRRCGEGSAPANIARIWERDMLRDYDRLAFDEPVRVSCFRLGGRLVLALPFEGFSQIGFHIRQTLREPEAIVLGCAEQLLGYLATRDDIARGGYASLESTFHYRRLPPIPGEAERLAQTLATILQKKTR